MTISEKGAPAWLEVRELHRLASLVPPPDEDGFAIGSHKPYMDFVNEVKRVFGTDVDMATVLINEIDRLTAENEELRKSSLYWHCPPGIGLIRCVPDKRFQSFAPEVRARYVPAVMLVDNNQDQIDATRYRWFRENSLRIVHASTVSWVYHLDEAIDAAMSGEGRT